MDYHLVEVKLAELDYDLHLQMWDTAGQERFQSITRWVQPSDLLALDKTLRQYFRKPSGIIIFFDGSKEDGIEQAERWASLVNDECDEHATIILVANKIDLGQNDLNNFIIPKCLKKNRNMYMSHLKWKILTFTILLEILKVRTCIGVFDKFLLENSHFLLDV